MRKRSTWNVVAALCAALFAGTVHGPVLAREGDAVIAMSGVIHPGAYEVFYTVVNRADPNLVVLSGPGGDLGTALRIASEVRRRGFDTAIPQGEYCASACAVIFLSGRTKYVARGARLGLHSASNLDGSFSREGTQLMGRFLAQVGVPAGVIARMQERRGNDMYWLSASDKRALNIVALGAALPSATEPPPRAARAAQAPAAGLAARGAGSGRCSEGTSGDQACYRLLPNGVMMKVR